MMEMDYNTLKRIYESIAKLREGVKECPSQNDILALEKNDRKATILQPPA